MHERLDKSWVLMFYSVHTIHDPFQHGHQDYAQRLSFVSWQMYVSVCTDSPTPAAPRVLGEKCHWLNCCLSQCPKGFNLPGVQFSIETSPHVNASDEMESSFLFRTFVRPGTTPRLSRSADCWANGTRQDEQCLPFYHLRSVIHRSVAKFHKT
jgi:hypothetical protein